MPGRTATRRLSPRRCKLAAASAYGTAGPEFVRRLIAEGVTRRRRARSIVNDFVAAEVPPGADGQIDRAAQRFGIIAAAGELATEFGLTGWREGEARDAAAWALGAMDRRARRDRTGRSPASHRDKCGISSRRTAKRAFDNLDDPDAAPVANRAGWRKGAGEDRRWLILPEVWKRDVCAGLDATIRRGVFWRSAACS